MTSCSAGQYIWWALVSFAGFEIVALAWLLRRLRRAAMEEREYRSKALKLWADVLKLRDEARYIRDEWKFAKIASDAANITARNGTK